LVVMTMLGGLLVGVVSTKDKTAPFYSRVPEIELSLKAHLVLLSIALLMIMAFFFFIFGSVNPLAIIPLARNPEGRLVYEQYDLGYFSLLTFGGAVFLHGWFLVRLFSISRSHVNLIVAVVATAVTMTATACYGSRATLFSPLVVFLFVFHYLYRPIPVTFMFLLFIALIPVFVFSRLVASGFDLSTLSRGIDLRFVFDEFLARFNLFDGLLDFLDWFKNKPFMFGETLLSIIVRPIPRQFFPNKPPSNDIFLSYQIYGRPYYGGGVQIFGAVGEMFYNFGYPGVFLWFILLGKLLYRFHFGLFTLLKDKRTLAATMLITNYALMRGLSNMGFNTVPTEQILVCAMVQGVFSGLIYLTLRVRGIPRSVLLRGATSGIATPIEK
jgi:oligosaccharide repeat unit polymerase